MKKTSTLALALAPLVLACTSSLDRPAVKVERQEPPCCCDHYEPMTCVPEEALAVEDCRLAPACAAAEVEIGGPAKVQQGGTFLGQPFVLRNTGNVPLTFHSYGPPVEGFAALTPRMIRVMPDGEERPFAHGWCGTGLERHVLAPDESLRFESGMHVDPDGDDVAYRVSVALTDPEGETVVATSPVVR